MTGQQASREPARVALVVADDRADGVERVVRLFGSPRISGRVFLKPNFNSGHPTPGSTSSETLEALVRFLWDAGASAITIGDRSGMMPTRQTMETKGVFAMAARLGVDVIVFDELPRSQWEVHSFPDSYWQRGFALPRPVLEADAIVQTCCLKTHRYGGHFTISLKNSVGLVAAQLPGESYQYMQELHASPHQRKMIADINTTYSPALVVVDALEAFARGGPHVGDVVKPGVFLAGIDRVAIDAVGVAILRDFGTTPPVADGPVFSQEQLARAVELGLGVGRAEDIEIVTDSPEAAAYAARLRDILRTAA